MSQQFPNVFVFDAGLWQHGKVVKELSDGRVVVRLSQRETIVREKAECHIKPESKREKDRNVKESGLVVNRLMPHKRREF